MLTFLGCDSPPTYTDDQLNIIDERLEKDGELKNDPNSPIPQKIRDQFVGLSYFEPDNKYVVKAMLEVADTHLYFTAPGKDSIKNFKAGNVIFKLGKKEQKLTAYWGTFEKKSLFIPFRDSTNGTETYGGGRYVDVDFNSSQSDKSNFVIDFNRCYNPYCAYNHEYTCVIPPPENYLKIQIKAGEKKFPLEEKY